MKILITLLLLISLSWGENPVGFQNGTWGEKSATVRQKANIGNWTAVQGDNLFPADMDITIFSTPQTIAGYDAITRFYFYKDQFFQATITFDFDDLKEYDFNYNVFISVDRYYREIRSKSLVFVADIYELLKNKYGKKQPLFMGVDPRNIFTATDNYIHQERWNLRYHPSEYYKRIIAQAYARWLYPKTEINFAVNISAADKRFDYTLSLTSLDFAKTIKRENRAKRSTGL